MNFQTQMHITNNENVPTDPEKEIPAKPDKNPDPTKQRPGGNEPNKVDPTRIEEPKKNDPTRIAISSSHARTHKWTKVSSWEEAFSKMQGEVKEQKSN